MNSTELETILATPNLKTLVRCSVPSDAIEIVESRVKRLANRAEKKGFPKPYLTLGPTSTRSITQPDGSETAIEYTEIAITAFGTLSLGGWHLVAVIAPVLKDGQTIGIATTVPGETARFDTIADWNRCDHCNTSRLRNETFIVDNESGERKQIGRQCLRDFLGHDPNAMIGWLDATTSLVSDDDLTEWGSSAPRLYRPTDIIWDAARVVGAEGFYISRQKAEEQHRPSTVDSIWMNIAGSSKDREEFDKDYPLTDAVTALHDATLKANTALLANDSVDNDWLWNVRSVVGLDWVQRRHVGIVASSVILGQRLLEREAKERVAASLKAARIAAGAREPQHVGTVGQRLTLDATIEFAKLFDGNYGATTLIKFRTDEGDLVQWWRSGEWEPEAGQRVRLTGTIKAHEIDRFSKEPVTVLTRCRYD